MLWPTDTAIDSFTIKTGRPRLGPPRTTHTYETYRSPLVPRERHTSIPRPRRLTRRTSTLLILFLICTILFLTRTLGNLARNAESHSDDDTSPARGLNLSGVRETQWGRWKAVSRRWRPQGGEDQLVVLESQTDTPTLNIDPNSDSDTLPHRADPPIEESSNPTDTNSQLISDDEDLQPQLALPELGNHTYHSNGLLQVNPEGAHPIYELVRRAERKWRDKHRRSSKTLKKAVREYQRRYGRLPPTGFDIWWDYVQKNSVPLPDEYDQINEDLAPFWAIDPADLQATERQSENTDVDSYTIGKPTWSSPLAILNFGFNGQGGRLSDHQPVPDDPELLDDAELITTKEDLPESLKDVPQSGLFNQFLNNGFNVLALMDEVQEHIPPFRAILSPHDNGNLLRDWARREEALDAARKRKILHLMKLQPTPADSGHLGWQIACPPFSPARRQTQSMVNWDAEDPYSTMPLPQPIYETSNKTFVHSHEDSMDPCLHPSHFITHGQFLFHRKGPRPERRGGGFIPMFSISPSRIHDDITLAIGEGSHYSAPHATTFEFDIHEGNEDDDFRMEIDLERLLQLPEDEIEHVLDLDTDPRLLWRGSNTGIWHAPKWGWERSQRARLVLWAGGGEGAAAHRTIKDSEREVERELGSHVDLKTARAFGAGLGGMLNVIAPPSNHYAHSNGTGNATRGAIGPLTSVKKSLYAPSMLDVAFAATGSDDGGVGPNSCEKETCEKMRKVFEFRKRMEMQEASRYRFVIDVDGHGWSSRYRKLLVGTSWSSHSKTSLSQEEDKKKMLGQRRWEQHLRRRGPDEPSASLVFKSTIYKEWWYDRAQPWVHYVPVQVGLEDVWDNLVFFKGKLGEEVDHLVMELRRQRAVADPTKRVEIEDLERRARDALERHLMGRKIARRGRKWAESYWRKEDMIAYMFRLFLEYARVMSPNRDQMFYDPNNLHAGIKNPASKDWDMGAQQDDGEQYDYDEEEDEWPDDE